jgi:hypothetical protein
VIFVLCETLRGAAPQTPRQGNDSPAPRNVGHLFAKHPDADSPRSEDAVFGFVSNCENKKPSTTEALKTQRKAREVKVIPGFLAFGFLVFDFLCASVSLCG